MNYCCLFVAFMLKFTKGGEVMRKRFFQPIWKFDLIEKELTSLEENGWRLDKIKGFRCFYFVKSKPKTAQYFLTYSITREKLNMNLIENALVQNFNANQIKGTFLEGLGGISVFRITKQAELTDQLNDRDIILQHYLFKKVVLGIILFSFLLAPLIIGVVTNSEKLLNDIDIVYLIFLISYFIFVAFYLIYNLFGLIYYNKKLKNK